MNRIEYTVVSANYGELFLKRVNDFLEEGWQLQGGVSVAVGNNVGFFQALTREIEPEVIRERANRTG